MKNFIVLEVCLCLLMTSLHAQSKLKINENSFQVDDLDNAEFVSFTKEKLNNSQFVFVGEQHGIKEVGIFTNKIYDIAQSFGYTNLCIETDALAATKIAKISTLKNPVITAKKMSSQFPYAIPFYNNNDDYELFKNVVRKKGSIWGIDQTFMVQFRLNFDHIITTTSNKKLKKKLIKLMELANKAFKNSIATKDFNANYIFDYDEVTHKELLNLSTDKEEKEIFHQLWKTKEIYTYNNITKEYYKNNTTRGQLMKSNFVRYYKEAQKKEDIPRVIFKLGATHATRGLSMTNIYDVSNLAAELAIFNNKHSVHYMVAGITGNTLSGNPFAKNPVISFDNTKQLPKELQEMLPQFTKKYTIIDLESLRKYAYGKRYSESLKKFIFNFDILVLVNNAEAVKPF